MKMAVIGLGYVGRSVLGGIVGSGHEAYVYELDEDVIERFRETLLSETYTTDGYLYMTIRENVHLTHLSNTYNEDLRAADVKFICVDTLNTPAAVQMVAPYIKQDDIVILESTIEVEIANLMKELIELHTSMKVGEDFTFAVVPERVMENLLLQNFESMPRPIGTTDRHSFKKVKSVYESLGVTGKLDYADFRHATAAKDFENAFRFIEISIANEFADICREKDLDYKKIQKLVNVKGHKMGYNQLLDSGIGIGGPCVPMAADIVARMDWENANLLRTAIEMNLGRPSSIAGAILGILREKFGDLTSKISVGIFGATYRANGADIRDSPAIEIISQLSAELNKETLYVYDPFYPEKGNLVKTEFTQGQFDAVIVLVGHDKFKDFSFLDCGFFIDLTGVVQKYPKGARRIKLQV